MSAALCDKPMLKFVPATVLSMVAKILEPYIEHLLVLREVAPSKSIRPALYLVVEG